ncbi:MAG TPA: hypothetical protein VKB09_05295 [Thermomicrobiales bacterium]|nr:hypothetical protein [Thermomicrobiales bacterium]
MIPGADGVRRRRVAGVLMLAIGVAVVLTSAGNVGRSGVAFARLQDGTDATNITCALTAEASEESATPASAPPVASPVASASPAPGQPADAATTAAIERTVRTLAACLTAGESETVAQLVTERYLGAVYGGGGSLSREDYLTLAPDLPDVAVTVSDVTDVRVESDRRANAEVATVVGNQLVRGRWSFVQAATGDATGDATTDAGVRWQVDAVVPLPVAPPAGAARVAVELSDYAFSLSRSSVAGPDVVLAGTNTGREDHEILVLRLARGVSTDALLRQPGPGLPEGVTFIGQVTISPGGRADLVLVDLPPGSYAIVCLLPTSDGTPHLALGMRARLRVTAPA